MGSASTEALSSGRGGQAADMTLPRARATPLVPSAGLAALLPVLPAGGPCNSPPRYSLPGGLAARWSSSSSCCKAEQGRRGGDDGGDSEEAREAVGVEDQERPGGRWMTAPR
jgi:hypothetical protein